VSRFGTRALVALATLAALAVVGSGPRAAAAYLPSAGTGSWDRVGLESGDQPSVSPDRVAPDSDRDGLPSQTSQHTGGGMTPPGSTTGGDHPPAGYLPCAGLSPDGLVVYFREPVAVLDLSTFVDSLLDPPRPG